MVRLRTVGGGFIFLETMEFPPGQVGLEYLLGSAGPIGRVVTNCQDPTNSNCT